MITRATALLVMIAALVAVAPAQAHYKPGEHNVTHAIRLAWCGKSNPWCESAREAVEVAQCESGLDWYAVNGQYLGFMQMGEYARSTYGHGPDPWSQAFAAERYWDAGSGKKNDGKGSWSPWECKPW